MMREGTPRLASSSSVLSPADPGTRTPAEPRVLVPLVMLPYSSGISSSTGPSAWGAGGQTGRGSGWGQNP